MIAIDRTNRPPEPLIVVPLNVAKAATALKKAFTEAQVRELIRLLHWSSVLEAEEGESR